MLTIHEFQASDESYARIVQVLNGAWPDRPTTVAEIKHRDATRNPAYYYRRLLGDVDGRTVAVGSALENSWSHRPGKYYVGVDVDLAFESDEIRGQLWAALSEPLFQREPAPVLLTSNTREDRPAEMRFLIGQGFEQVMRSARSRLEVQAFDFAPYAGLIEQVEAGGIAIRSLAELMDDDPEWQRKMYDLDWAAGQDEPSPEPLTRISFEDFARQFFDAPNFLPEGMFIAVDGDEYVGLSGLERDLVRPEHLYTGFTAVVPSHRRRKIASALKLKAIAFARQYGAKTLGTGNEENNPMYQINLRLGFRPLPGWVDFHKKIEQE